MSETGSRRGKVVRDASWVEREYGGEKWPSVLHNIRAAIAEGETSLGRLVAAMARREWGAPSYQPMTAVALGERVSLPASLAWHGSYALVAEAVIAACREHTDAVIDLGCGWGRSLFEVWLKGGPRAASYCALEFTEAGLDCVRALAALEPGLTLRTARFDFRRPDFSFLPAKLRHAVVFTISSVHQVPQVSDDALRAILPVADTVDCLFFEQIGWQIEDNDQRAADRDYALRNDYNQNLWGVLSRMRDAGEIELVDVQPDLFGTQAVYPLSLVHWRRLNPARTA